jgi:hypothetical protein
MVAETVGFEARVPPAEGLRPPSSLVGPSWGFRLFSGDRNTYGKVPASLAGRGGADRLRGCLPSGVGAKLSVCEQVFGANAQFRRHTQSEALPG